MWGEGINKRNFDAYVWHGAAAIAERLWSDPAQTTDLDAARDRLARVQIALVREAIKLFRCERGCLTIPIRLHHI